MTWDREKFGRLDYDSYGFDGAEIDLSAGDFPVPDTVKGIMVVAEGDVVCRPKKAGADITIAGAPVGLMLPWHCSHIRQTSGGTTASLATVIG